MPTILVLFGWRLFFYANEGSEPMHVHCRNGDMECKYWIDMEKFDIQEAYAFQMSPKQKTDQENHLRAFRLYCGAVAGIPKEAINMSCYHHVENIVIENGMLFLRVDGRSLRTALVDVSPRLSKASKEELLHFEISPSGYGIHWPLLDEDLSIDGLLGIPHSPAEIRKTA